MSLYALGVTVALGPRQVLLVKVNLDRNWRAELSQELRGLLSCFLMFRVRSHGWQPQDCCVWPAQHFKIMCVRCQHLNMRRLHLTQFLKLFCENLQLHWVHIPQWLEPDSGCLLQRGLAMPSPGRTLPLRPLPGQAG